MRAVKHGGVSGCGWTSCRRPTSLTFLLVFHQPFAWREWVLVISVTNGQSWKPLPPPSLPAHQHPHTRPTDCPIPNTFISRTSSLPQSRSPPHSSCDSSLLSLAWQRIALLLFPFSYITVFPSQPALRYGRPSDVQSERSPTFSLSLSLTWSVPLLLVSWCLPLPPFCLAGAR